MESSVENVGQLFSETENRIAIKVEQTFLTINSLNPAKAPKESKSFNCND